MNTCRAAQLRNKLPEEVGSVPGATKAQEADWGGHHLKGQWFKPRDHPGDIRRSTQWTPNWSWSIHQSESEKDLCGAGWMDEPCSVKHLEWKHTRFSFTVILFIWIHFGVFLVSFFNIDLVFKYLFVSCCVPPLFYWLERLPRAVWDILSTVKLMSILWWGT